MGGNSARNRKGSTPSASTAAEEKQPATPILSDDGMFAPNEYNPMCSFPVHSCPCLIFHCRQSWPESGFVLNHPSLFFFLFDSSLACPDSNVQISPIPSAFVLCFSFTVHAEYAEGETPEGEKFIVPRTADTLEAFFHPTHANIVALITLIPFLCWVYLYAVVGVPIYVNVIHFFCARLLYNAGLGYILNTQSKYKTLTKWYTRVTADKNSLLAKVVLRLTYANLPQGKTPADYPDAFNAWCFYKGLVNFVLASDSSAYFLLTCRCFSWPSEFDFLTIAQYAIGLGLFAFFWWAKVDAHRCIGTYCWYWGDFFYRKNVHLTFDGIFELFPHPMYTVGYAIYYGVSLICRSYTMLFVSLAAHMSQLVFLVLVEEPHIKRTYGGDDESPILADPDRAKKLYNPEDGWFPSKADLLYFFSLDFTNSGTWSLVMGIVYVFLTAFIPASPIWAVAQVAVWRLVHWVGIGTILWLQSERQWWSRIFMRRGRSLHDAFDHWKRIFHLSTAVNVAAFVAMTIRFLPTDTQVIFSVSYLARCAVAGVLFAIAYWTAYSTYRSIGDFGWFYGDFFIPTDRYQHTLVYTGIYRFLNNPDAMTGYAGLYGLALLSQSYYVLALAMASQVMNMLFVNLVEVPHMRKLYDSSEFRSEGPLRRKIKSLIDKALPDVPDKVKDQNDKLISEMRNVRSKALIEVFSIYKKIASLRRKNSMRPATTANEGSDVSTSSLSINVSGKGGKKRAGSSNSSPSSSSSSSSSSSTSNSVSSSSSSSASGATNQVATPQNTRLFAPKLCKLGEPLQIGFETGADHADTDWVGVYAIDVPSVPGLSDGKWVYVPAGSKGTILMKPWLLPRNEGVYELRYHSNNAYDVIASRPIVFSAEASKQMHDELEEVGSPAD